MSKTLILAFVLLGSAAYLHAQAGYPGLDKWESPGNASSLIRIQGCLESSGGHYTVTHKDGSVHHLQGNTASLSRYVGHEVEITGKPSVRTTDTSMLNIAASAEEEPVLIVESAKQTSGTCNSAAR